MKLTVGMPVLPVLNVVFGSKKPFNPPAENNSEKWQAPEKWQAFEEQYWQAFQKEASPSVPVTLPVLAAVMLGKPKPKQPVPGRVGYFFSNMLDANQDGELSRSEWSSFVSKIRQTLADKNLPVPPSHLLLFARALSDGQYLKERASQVDLKPHALLQLEKRLDQAAFGLHQENILNGFDMAIQMGTPKLNKTSKTSQTQKAQPETEQPETEQPETEQPETEQLLGWQVWMKKYLGLAKQWDDLMGLLTPLVNPDQLKQVQQACFKAFSETGLLPVWSYEHSGLLERRVKIRRVKASGKQHRQNILLMSRVRALHANSQRLKLKTSPWKLDCRLNGIDPEAFRLPATHVDQAGSDALRQAKQALSNTLVDVLNQVRSDNRLASLCAALVRAGDPTLSLDDWQTQLIEPLTSVYQSILDALNMKPVPLALMDGFENETGGESRATGLFDSTATPPCIVLNAGIFQKRLAEWVKRYPEVNEQGQSIRGVQVAYDFLATLLEEVVHAHQFQMTQDWEAAKQWQYTADRLLDYRDAFQYQGFSGELSTALFGHDGYYTRQPLELDAKQVVKDVLTVFLPTML